MQGIALTSLSLWPQVESLSDSLNLIQFLKSIFKKVKVLINKHFMPEKTKKKKQTEPTNQQKVNSRNQGRNN